MEEKKNEEKDPVHTVKPKQFTRVKTAKKNDIKMNKI